MYKQLKKVPRYLFKLLKKGNIKEVYHIAKHVKLKHLLIALAGRLDERSVAVELRNLNQYLEINSFIKLISHRRQHIEDDLYMWEFGNKHICGNYMQLVGLYGEYVSDKFDEIYSYDWKDKTVVDIGGFVGDTALYFLSKGAKKVIIFEPVPKNIRALHHNLKTQKQSIECHPMALADKDGPFILSSEQPECSSSFGCAEGKFQLKCQGITMTTILNQHPLIDIVKVDCEGGEVHLLEMTNKEIRSVPYWIVETHTKELYRKIIQKFTDHGFSISDEIAMSSEVDLLHFRQ